MSDPFVGEIAVFAGNYAPMGWALCNGQLLSISGNSALFSLLGTTYGGNGQTNFALPNLMGVAPMQAGQGPGLTDRSLGEAVGSQSVTLLTPQMPGHTHVPMANAAEASATAAAPTGKVWGAADPFGASIYAAATNPVAMNPVALGVTGGSQPHNNMQPYLGLTFIIALQGIFPQRP
jgi:microcystin-dependent protein